MELIVQNIRKILDGKEIVKGVSFRCRTGEKVAILGPNGAGKTTTFLVVTGFYKADGGKVSIKIGEEEKDISHLSTSERAKIGIVYLPQECSLFDDLSVLDNFKISCELSNIPENRITQVANMFGIEDIMMKKVGALSGGERRKAEIARISLLSPKFLILDEPFAGIDPKSVVLIANIINEISRDIGIIISDHNVRDVLKICTRAYLIYDGRTIEEGKPDEIVNSCDARFLFFGENFKL